MMLAVAVKMQSARDELFAGPAFANDQDRAVGVRHFPDQIVNVLHVLACADDVFELVAIFEFFPEINVLAQRRLII